MRGGGDESAQPTDRQTHTHAVHIQVSCEGLSIKFQTGSQAKSLQSLGIRHDTRRGEEAGEREKVNVVQE